ncbi:N-acetylmannosamine-6-phosphate 2-epimerase [Listeria aquatica]|uniref:N-acetylmannosamine-6-phosphate 2-epimerase n=1 Tax=Listeria aquatica TaxID=1494960 RepID=UPI0031F4CE98
MLEKMKDGIIVSCQALADEPLYSSFVMSKMALAAQMGGAVGIRSNSAEDIEAIKAVVDLPLIGLIKRDYPDSEVYITPTEQEVLELLETKAEIIALDGTERTRPGDADLKQLVEKIHQAGKLAMADIATFQEGVRAEEIGFDLVGTTLAGYTEESKEQTGPAFQLVESLSQTLKIPVICEGHIETPEEVQKAYQSGAYTVVVGSAITRPQLLTKKFVQAAPKNQ